jgi:hypothetical protein
MLATFPTQAQKTAPQWLQLSPDGMGALLHHFSTLAIVPASCPYVKQSGSPSCAAGGTELRLDCPLSQLCSNVAVSCCVDPGSSANSCDFGAANLQFGATAIDSGPSYCPVADGGQQDGSTDAGAADASAGDTSVGQDSASVGDSAVVEASASDSAGGPDTASVGDSSAGPDAASGGDGAADATPPVDAAGDSGVNGTCGTPTYSQGNLGPGGCVVSRSDGTATIGMVCTGGTGGYCQCYVNNTPYGQSFDIGQSPCAVMNIAVQQMQAYCGCP